MPRSSWTTRPVRSGHHQTLGDVDNADHTGARERQDGALEEVEDLLARHRRDYPPDQYGPEEPHGARHLATPGSEGPGWPYRTTPWCPP
ncbi:hypothetical protein, partial [Nannocystis sp.]|uniref:hypothetical protein n=1 Tax=Nannocystis sp. TaxID=1962667 RepID=UPI0025D89BFC